MIKGILGIILFGLLMKALLKSKHAATHTGKMTMWHQQKGPLCTENHKDSHIHHNQDILSKMDLHHHFTNIYHTVKKSAILIAERVHSITNKI